LLEEELLLDEEFAVELLFDELDAELSDVLEPPAPPAPMGGRSGSTP